KIAFVNQHARLGVIEDGGELGGSEPHVKRHDDGADERDAEVAGEELVVIEAEVGDAVAGLNAHGPQAGGEPLAVFAEIRVGIPANAGDDADFLPVEIHSAIEAADRRQGYLHDWSIVSTTGVAASAQPSRGA